MQKKSLLRFGFIAFLLAASLTILNSSYRKKGKPACCKESMDQCPKKERQAPGGMIWETLSRQFFSFTSSY